MTSETAWAWLTDEGFFSKPNVLSRLVTIVRPPGKRELNMFILVIKTLGAWSVGNGGRVYVTQGSEPNQLAFRLVERQE